MIGVTRARFAVVLSLACACACGYTPLRSSLQGHPHVRVVRAVSHVPEGSEASAAGEAETGARAELARWGALDDGSDADTDRLTIEIVRIDEHGEGETVVAGALGDKPLARGVVVRITLRGEVEGSGGAFSTPDVDATETLAADPSDALGWNAARAAALRTAARRAGAQVARDVLGVP